MVTMSSETPPSGSPRLIAIMGDSYEKVKEHDKVEALHERAKMIVEMELQNPSFDTFFEFMHMVEAADEDSKPALEWQGITGRVKQLLEPLSNKVQQLDGRMDEMTGKLDEMRESQKESQRESQIKFDEMRDLLKLLLAGQED